MSQTQQILECLKRGEVVTPAIAHELTGSFACHSRISEIRAMGYDVICTIRRNGRSKWGEYALRQPELFA